jgi:hypothetical protein
MGCDCCGSRDLTTGGCVHCMSATFCGTCGARFCSAHCQEGFSKHVESCPGIIRIQTVIPVPTQVW